jgi:hypothetical protein
MYSQRKLPADIACAPADPPQNNRAENKNKTDILFIILKIDN